MADRQTASPAKVAAKRPKTEPTAPVPLRRTATAAKDVKAPTKTAAPRPQAQAPTQTTPTRPKRPAADTADPPPSGPGKSHRSTGYRQRSYYIPDELHMRARNTWWWTQNRPGGLQSMSDLVASALEAMVEAMEDIHNDGKPLPPAPDSVRSGPSPAGAERQKEAMKIIREGRLKAAGRSAKTT